jgi:dTDP-4-dehydrorhamnose 3,5-epimerase
MARVDMLNGVHLICTPKFDDNRGWFCPLSNSDTLKQYGFEQDFFQANLSWSSKNVIRGMHKQDQIKAVTPLSGRIFDVVLDTDSGDWMGVVLDPGDMLVIPREYAHGFLALEETLLQYFVDRRYNPILEKTYNWSKFGITWPVDGEPILSDKDRDA